MSPPPSPKSHPPPLTVARLMGGGLVRRLQAKDFIITAVGIIFIILILSVVRNRSPSTPSSSSPDVRLSASSSSSPLDGDVDPPAPSVPAATADSSAASYPASRTVYKSVGAPRRPSYHSSHLIEKAKKEKKNAEARPAGSRRKAEQKRSDDADREEERRERVERLKEAAKEAEIAQDILEKQRQKDALAKAAAEEAAMKAVLEAAAGGSGSGSGSGSGTGSGSGKNKGNGSGSSKAASSSPPPSPSPAPASSSPPKRSAQEEGASKQASGKKGKKGKTSSKTDDTDESPRKKKSSKSARRELDDDDGVAQSSSSRSRRGEDDEEEPSTKKKSKKKKEKAQADDDSIDEESESRKKRKKKSKAKRTEEEEEEGEAPKKKKKKPSKKSSEDDEEAADSKPSKPPPSKKSSMSSSGPSSSPPSRRDAEAEAGARAARKSAAEKGWASMFQGKGMQETNWIPVPHKLLMNPEQNKEDENEKKWWLIGKEAAVVIIAPKKHLPTTRMNVVKWGMFVKNLIIFSDGSDESINTITLTPPSPSAYHIVDDNQKYSTAWLLPKALQYLLDHSDLTQDIEFFYVLRHDVFPLLDQLDWRAHQYRRTFRTAEQEDEEKALDLPVLKNGSPSPAGGRRAPDSVLGPYPPFIAGRPHYEVIDIEKTKPLYEEQMELAKELFHQKRVKKLTTYMFGISPALLQQLGPSLNPKLCPYLVPLDMTITGLLECAGIPAHDVLTDWLSMTRDSPTAKGVNGRSTLSQWRVVDAYSKVDSPKAAKEAYEAYYQRRVLDRAEQKAAEGEVPPPVKSQSVENAGESPKAMRDRMQVERFKMMAKLKGKDGNNLVMLNKMKELMKEKGGEE